MMIILLEKLVEKYFDIYYGNKLEYIGFKKDHPTKKRSLYLFKI